MGQRAPKTFAQLAGALFLIALLAWGWSYLPSHFHVESARGQLFLIYSDGPIAELDSDSPDFQGYDAMVSGIAGQAPRNRRWTGLGFGVFMGDWAKYLPHSNGGAITLRYVAAVVPYWAVVSTAALLALLACWRVRRLRRREFHGSCLACGYDLRFSRNRCPECGSHIPEQARIEEAVV